MTVLIEMTESEALVVTLTMGRMGARPIAMYLQDRYSEPTWTEAAVKARQRELIKRIDPR